jgi:nucleobase:cation symporter-1, NCS1 family
VNPRAMIALILGVVIALIGLFVPSLRYLYDYAWFVGFFVAGLIYLVSMRTAPNAALAQAEESAEEVA